MSGAEMIRTLTFYIAAHDVEIPVRRISDGCAQD